MQSPFAREVIERLQAVYAIEAEIRGSSAEQRLAVRRTRTAPLMKELKARLTSMLDQLFSQSSVAGSTAPVIRSRTPLANAISIVPPVPAHVGIPTAPAQPRRPQIAPRSSAAAPSRLPMTPFGPAAAKPSANCDAHHAGGPPRRRSPKLSGFPRRSEASRPSTISAAVPDPTKSKPCSRSLICLQINQQTIAGKVAARKAALTGGVPLELGDRKTDDKPIGVYGSEA